MTLLGRVVFHLEGAETTARLNASGEPVCLVRTLGSDRWIEDVADGHMTALDLLALAFSHLCFRANDVRALVHGWREELRRAVEAGEVTPRDPSSRLPCRADFEGLGWLVSRADAARLLERHQTGIDLDATIAELLEVARRRGEAHHHPGTGEWIESRWLAGHEPQDWSRPAAIEPVEWCEMLAEGWFMPEAQTPAEPTPAPSASAPAVAGQDAGPEFSMLATRERLIQAFGPFTGMDASWFDNLKDTPALLRSRRVTGTGGRGHTMEPWFCPFDVMNWLCSSRRKKGRPMQKETGWRMLQRHFPKVYAAHEAEAPDPD